MKLMAEWLKKKMKIWSIVVNKLTNLNVKAISVNGEYNNKLLVFNQKAYRLI